MVLGCLQMAFLNRSAYLLSNHKQNNCVIAGWFGSVGCTQNKKQENRQARHNNGIFDGQYIYLLFNFYNLGFLFSKNLWLLVWGPGTLFPGFGVADYRGFAFWPEKHLLAVAQKVHKVFLHYPNIFDGYF